MKFTGKWMELERKEKHSLKWKLKASLESQLCQIGFCWGKHSKEHFAGADTRERMFC